MQRLLFVSLRIAPAVVLALATVVGVLSFAPAHAQDFFSFFFRPFEGQRMAPSYGQGPLGYGGEPPARSRRAERAPSPGAAYCVRTCDGRYFPAPPVPDQSRAAACNSFCPASETKVFYGSSIDDATTENGKAYSELPNAFKYRSTLVKGCTCNGTNPVGLAKVDISDDKTVRRGDMVAQSGRIMVVSGKPDRRGASLNFTPAPRSIQKRFERGPRLAAE